MAHIVVAIQGKQIHASDIDGEESIDITSLKQGVGPVPGIETTHTTSYTQTGGFTVRRSCQNATVESLVTSFIAILEITLEPPEGLFLANGLLEDAARHQHLVESHQTTVGTGCGQQSIIFVTGFRSGFTAVVDIII